jgi:hypothetical protein
MVIFRCLLLQDVLLAILACFPEKQRAVPLRAVCRGWRDLFNSSVHTITIHSNLQLLPQSPSRFPNLHHLCISQTNSTAAKAAVRLLGVPNYKELTMLEISNTWMQVHRHHDQRTCFAPRNYIVHPFRVPQSSCNSPATSWPRSKQHQAAVPPVLLVLALVLQTVPTRSCAAYCMPVCHAGAS